MKKYIIPAILFFTLGISPIYAQQQPEKKTSNQKIEKPVMIAEPSSEQSPSAARIESKEKIEYQRERNNRNQRQESKMLLKEQEQYPEVEIRE